jgi:hypothetical protein
MYKLVEATGEEEKRQARFHSSCEICLRTKEVKALVLAAGVPHDTVYFICDTCAKMINEHFGGEE